MPATGGMRVSFLLYVTRVCFCFGRVCPSLSAQSLVSSLVHLQIRVKMLSEVAWINTVLHVRLSYVECFIVVLPIPAGRLLIENLEDDYY